jgi:hypothetical protein
MIADSYIDNLNTAIKYADLAKLYMFQGFTWKAVQAAKESAHYGARAIALRDLYGF